MKRRIIRCCIAPKFILSLRLSLIYSLFFGVIGTLTNAENNVEVDAAKVFSFDFEAISSMNIRCTILPLLPSKSVYNAKMR